MKSKILVRLLMVLGGMLPPSYMRPFGPASKKVRNFLARQISPSVSPSANIEKGGYVLPDTVVGDRSSIGVRSEICKGLTIGRNVMMGPECLFYSTSHRFDKEKRVYEGYTEVNPIVIEDDVWIGRRAVIMGGVTIGKGSTIGANAVVTKDIPPYSLAVGVPAKVKKSLLD